jgi:simple sugar transport system substrate-binding protein
MSEELESRPESGMERSTFLKSSLIAAATVSYGGLLSQTQVAAAADELLGHQSAIAPRRNIRIEYPQTGGLARGFFTVIANGAHQAGRDLGINVAVRGTATFDGTIDQPRLFRAAIATRPTGIVTGVWDPAAMKGPITNAVKSGIRVVMINQGQQQWKNWGALAYVGQDEYLAGVEGGKRMRAAGVKKAFILNHNLAEQALRLRQNGFIHGFQGQTRVVATDVNSVTNSVNRIKAAITSTNFDGLFSLGAQPNADAALLAVAAMHKQNQFKIGTFDFDPTVLKALESRQVLFAIDQQQYLQGYLPMLWITLNVQYGLKPYTAEVTGPNIILPKDAASVVGLSAAGYR